MYATNGGDRLENLLLAGLQQRSLTLEEEPIRHDQHGQLERRKNQIDRYQPSEVKAVQKQIEPQRNEEGDEGCSQTQGGQKT